MHQQARRSLPHALACRLVGEEARHERPERSPQRRFNSLNTNILKNVFVNQVVTVEPQMRGAVHYHLVVVCQEDIRTGFDFGTFQACQAEFKAKGRSTRFRQLTKTYVASASPCLQALWKELRPLMKRYHFGRFELLPIRSNADGIAHYVSKYPKKGCRFRGEQFKGARMVRYSRGWRCVSQNFAWYESGAKWRRTVEGVALFLGVSTMDDMQKKVGSQWAYKILSLVMAYEAITPAEIASVIVMGK